MLVALMAVPLQRRVDHGEFIVNVGQLRECAAGLGEQAASGHLDPLLRQIAEGDCTPALDRARIGVELAGDEAEEGGLAGAVGAHQPNPVAFT